MSKLNHINIGHCYKGIHNSIVRVENVFHGEVYFTQQNRHDSDEIRAEVKTMLMPVFIHSFEEMPQSVPIFSKNNSQLTESIEVKKISNGVTVTVSNTATSSKACVSLTDDLLLSLVTTICKLYAEPTSSEKEN